MTDIRGGNGEQVVWPRGELGLRREDHIGIERVRVGGRLPLLAHLCPQLGCPSHCRRIKRQVLNPSSERVKPAQRSACVQPQKLPPYLVVPSCGSAGPGASASV